MKNYLFFTVLLAIIFAIFPTLTANAKTIKGDKKIVTKEVKIKDYTAITLNGSADVIYEQKESASAYLTVEIDNNLFEYLDIQVIGNDLVIKQKNSTSINPTKYIIRTNSKQLEKASVHGSGDISILGKVKADKLDLLVKGSGDISINDLSTSSFSADVRGSGDIKSVGVIKANAISLLVMGSGDISMINLDANSISAEVKGSGDIKIKGKAASARYSAAGSGDLKAKELVASTAYCSVVGSGSIEANATQDINCDIKGSGDIHYLGNPPQMQKNIKGSGSVTKLN